VALVEDTAVWIGHVGDSRAYLVRDGRLEQLTEDHSLVAELVRSGKLSPEEAEIHPQRSVITRALGTDPDVDVDVFCIPPEHAAPSPERRGRRSRRVAAIAALIVVAVFAGLALLGLSRAHFVGAERSGHVAVYQGLPWDLFAGIRLYRLRYESPLLAAQLSQDERRQLFGPH